jgi:hypothetical protein
MARNSSEREREREMERGERGCRLKASSETMTTMMKMMECTHSNLLAGF